MKRAAVGPDSARAKGADAAAIARASRVVAAQITLAATAIVVLVIALTVAFIIDQSQPSELVEKSAPGETKIYVDAHAVLLALVALGIIAIVVAGGLSWVIASRAVRPLGEALRIQRTFVADASHELRTPVAVVAARVELLGQEMESGADTRENLEDLRQDVRVLGDVITDLLLAAASPGEIESGRTADVASLAQETLDDLQLIASERGVVLRLDAREQSITHVPRSTLRRCIVALVDNAIAHSPARGTVTVTIEPAKEPSFFALSVRDEGEGVKGIDPDRLFERFAHGDVATRGNARSGFGIGLALVRDIADRYGGRIELTATSSAGTCFTLTLPQV